MVLIYWWIIDKCAALLFCNSKAPFTWRNAKLVPLGYSTYPRRANFFYISLKNLANRLHVGLTSLVTLAHYSLYKHWLAQPGQEEAISSISERCCQLLARTEGWTFFSYKRWLKLIVLGGCTSNIQTGPKPIAFLPFSIAVAPWLLLRSQDKRRLGRLNARFI